MDAFSWIEYEQPLHRFNARDYTFYFYSATVNVGEERLH
jgi:hypothetical protein